MLESKQEVTNVVSLVKNLRENLQSCSLKDEEQLNFKAFYFSREGCRTLFCAVSLQQTTN